MTDRHVIRAGQRLGLSQPAVSAALNRLRGTLNDDLFVRSGAEMVPTPRALALAEHCRLAPRGEALSRLPSRSPSEL